MAISDLAKSLKVGSLLMLETDDEVIVGTLNFIDKKREMLELSKAIDYKTNSQFDTNQIVAFSKINRIKVMPNEEDTIEQNECLQKESSQTPNDYKKVVQSNCYVHQLTNSELQSVQKQLDAIVYMTQSDCLYHKALADIRAQSMVSLIVEPSDAGRHKRTSIIVVATPQSVYIFDMLAFGCVFKGLKLLLESELPRKAVHNSPFVVDQLKYRLGVNLNGIFDTFVAECLTTGVKEPIAFVELLQTTFNVSTQYFEYVEENDRRYSIDQRPMPANYRRFLAKLAIFQLKLQEHQLHKRMLATFIEQCSNYSKTFVDNKDVVDVAMQMQPNMNSGFEHIQPESGWKRLLQTKFDSLTCNEDAN